ncbi:S9 family peptidase [Silanimonas sp.]|uniref:S9 family peptidase n=1 Tax=Silanimonas sp. TaxID=1929290 RepID=UPI001BC270AB|nr:S9 family peptidase [Silanimonas sp.]MBS3895864.1 S9 family peptidase [Silanimonas sp.]MBS3924831.1 S9 family peptidase [Xanthomonadaceae bacterium]
MRTKLPPAFSRLVLAATLLLPLPVLAVTPAAATTEAMPVHREVVGNRISENIPSPPDALLDRLNRFQSTRGASFAGWTSDGAILISTRFGETNQVHRVIQPLGMREQITFHREPTMAVQARPGQPGFVFGRDEGGSEFWQLYRYNLATREATRITDGRRSRNEAPLWSHDGQQLAFTSTMRNGVDSDIWVQEGDAPPRLVLQEGGTWFSTDFSRDGQRLLVQRRISINESRPAELDLRSGRLRMLSVADGPVAFGLFRYAPDGRSVYFTSDMGGEFLTLHHRPLERGPAQALSADIPWDVTGFDIADDGRHLVFATNEDGIGRLHLRTLPDHRPVALPELPVGVIGNFGFSPDGTRIAVTLNTATSPSDVFVIDIAAGTLKAWTRSEVGGLDASRFVAPILIRYESFDGLSIPAFFYRPAHIPAGTRVPVVIQIHGGPEAQAFPSFSPTIQYMVNEMGMAVLVPNVRGSSGYGRTFLKLDNGFLRKDAVRDIGALLDWIERQPELDAERVGVFGGSYGGYMVLASMVDFPDRIAAGVSVVGISNFVTFLEATEAYRRDLRRVEYGDERDPAMRAFMQEIAPANNAHRITSPLFVAQGANDPRVPLSEAEQIVRAVRANGRDVWYLVFKDEGHGFARRSNADWFTAATMLFWQKHLVDAGQQ